MSYIYVAWGCLLLDQVYYFFSLMLNEDIYPYTLACHACEICGVFDRATKQTISYLLMYKIKGRSYL
jgi:hypothetical protein